MGAYEPTYLYATTITGTASAAIVGGQVLAVSGNGTVGPAGAASNAVIGVAANDAANGDLVPYFPRGKVHIGTAAGAITAGDRVNSAAAGAIATGVAALTNIGVALTTAADTAACSWMEI